MLEMIVIGADTHKRQHTLAGVDEVTGRVAGEKTVPVKRAALQDMVRWARSLGEDRVWAPGARLDALSKQQAWDRSSPPRR